MASTGSSRNKPNIRNANIPASAATAFFSGLVIMLVIARRGLMLIGWFDLLQGLEECETVKLQSAGTDASVSTVIN